MNIELLNNTLEVAENPGLDTFDPRFGDITTLVENGDYPDAAAQAEEIMKEGIYDIRITGCFFYGHFLEEADVLEGAPDAQPANAVGSHAVDPTAVVPYLA